MEELVHRLPTVLKNIVAEYTFHTLHREQISETLNNIKIRGIIDDEERIWTDLSVEEDEKYIKICNKCTCCPRHIKNRPESLYPKDHKSYVMTIYKGLEMYKKNKHHICSCMCRHVSRNIVRFHDPFGYNEYFDYRAFFIHNYNGVAERLTEIKASFNNIQSSSSSQESYLPLINMLRRLKQNKKKLDKRLIKLHTALRNITATSSSPLIDYDDTPNLHHKYIHLCDDTHELLYDIKMHFKTKDANDITREVLQLCNL